MVKVYEVTELPFNKVDDVVVFMRNDPMFYRKQYFPTFANIADMQREGSNDDPKSAIMPMIEKGINQYCAKFNIARSPDEVFNNNDRAEIFDKIYKEELEQIKKGEYK
jgi:hypothetical protein